MDYREEMLNKILIALDGEEIKPNRIKNKLIEIIGGYEVAERCTELAVIDNSNMQIAKMYLATKKVEGGSVRTARTRWSVITQFDKEIRKPFADVSTFDILSWLAMVQQKVSLSTAECYRAVLASMYNWMEANGIIENNPMKKVNPIKHPAPLKKSFTPIEVDAIKTACKSKLERAMVEFLLSTGLRCEELCNLKWDDINFETRDVYVIEGKGGKNRVTMMDDVASKYLIEYRNGLNFKSEYVFAVKYGNIVKQRTTDSVWRKLKAVAERAGIEEANPHKFRHTFATTLYRRGLDVRMIQKLLGHSNIATTMIYIDSDVSTLRDAYKRCY